MSMVTSFGDFMRRTLEAEAAAQMEAAQQRERDAESRAALFRNFQSGRFESHMGDVWRAMEQDGFRLEAVYKRDQSSRTEQAWLHLFDPAIARAIVVVYQGAPDTAERSVYKVTHPSILEPTYGNPPRTIEISAADLPRVLTIVIAEGRQREEQQRAEAAANAAKAEQARQEEEKRTARYQLARQREIITKERQSIARGLEHDRVKKLLAHTKEMAAKDLWSWPTGPDGSAAPVRYYKLGVVRGGFVDEDGEPQFREEEHLMIDPNCHDGNWGFITPGGKLVPTRLLNTPPVKIETLFARGAADLPSSLKESVYIDVEGLLSDGGAAFTRGQGIVPLLLHYVPIQPMRNSIDAGLQRPQVPAHPGPGDGPWCLPQDARLPLSHEEAAAMLAALAAAPDDTPETLVAAMLEHRPDPAGVSEIIHKVWSYDFDSDAGEIGRDVLVASQMIGGINGLSGETVAKLIDDARAAFDEVQTGTDQEGGSDAAF